MTTKTANFVLTQNPLDPPWVTNLSGGMRANGSGAVGITNSAYNGSLWDAGNYAFANDQTSEITVDLIVGSPYDQPGAMVRAATAGGGSCYVVSFDTGNTQLKLERFAGGVSAGTIDTLANTVANGDKLKLTISGATLNVYLNSVLVMGPYTDANIASGQPGIFYGRGGGTVGVITDWTGTDSSGGGSPTLMGQACF